MARRGEAPADASRSQPLGVGGPKAGGTGGSPGRASGWTQPDRDTIILEHMTVWLSSSLSLAQPDLAAFAPAQPAACLALPEPCNTRATRLVSAIVTSMPPVSISSLRNPSTVTSAVHPHDRSPPGPVLGGRWPDRGGWTAGATRAEGRSRDECPEGAWPASVSPCAAQSQDVSCAQSEARRSPWRSAGPGRRARRDAGVSGQGPAGVRGTLP